MTAFFAVLFVVCLLFSIALHELGHLLTAKWAGMKVQQYFIGFGPKIWSTQRGETEYGVKALPLGGFVRIAGMNPYEEVPPEDADRVFKAKKPWKRAIVLSAGSFTHFVLAFIILTLVFSLASRPDFDKPTTTVGGVSTEFEGQPSPAAEAGFLTGDTIVSVDGVEVETWSATIEELKAHPGETIPVVVVRDGETLTLTPTLQDHRPDSTDRVGFLGVGPRYERATLSPVSAVGEAGSLLGRGTVESLKGLKEIFTPNRIGQIFSQLSGGRERGINDPTTIVGLTGQAGQLGNNGDYASLFILIALFNIFIGVANMLPLPPLDGGHVAVLTYEKIRRREVDVRKLMPITTMVILAFGTLFLMLLVLDITQPIALPQ